jgi:YHS domain-containing protein/copper chaperone CopZ
MAIDLVCGMIVDEKSFTAKTSYDGNKYFFCATHCREVFDLEPRKYIEENMEWGEAVDPVCGMTVNIPKAAAMSFLQDQFIYFCNKTCKEIFDTSPEKYFEAQKEGGLEVVAHLFGKDLSKVDLPITGMSCAGCVVEIEKGLSKMNGIVDARVNFETENATIYFDPSEVGMRDFMATIKELESRLSADMTKQIKEAV